MQLSRGHPRGIGHDEVLRSRQFGTVLAGISILLIMTASPARSGGAYTADSAPWVGAIRVMDDALARGDLRAALRAREDARIAALASQRWEGIAMVGDATLRLAQRAGLTSAMEPAARRAYVFALHRARRQGSLEGVLHITRTFAGLGDHDMVRIGFAIAERLAVASPTPHALERVRALEEGIVRMSGRGNQEGEVSTEGP